MGFDMRGLDKELLAVVYPSFKGKKLEKLQNSVRLLEESLALGSWVKYGSVKVPSGFQGLYTVPHGSLFEGAKLDILHALYADVSALQRLMSYGYLPQEVTPFYRTYDDNGNRSTRPEPRPPKLVEAHELLCKATSKTGKLLKIPSIEVIYAWLSLNKQRKEISTWLDKSRKPPVVTEIGLSPLVTATLKEMNLDIDLSSIVPAKIERREKWEDIINSKGEKVKRLTYEYYVAWREGIAHGRSVHSRGGRQAHCHACGHAVPSGNFVCLEAYDNIRKEWVSLVMAKDCAKNVFGVMDVGVHVDKIGT